MRELSRERSARYTVLAAWILTAVLGGYLVVEASRLYLLQRYAYGSYSYDLLFSSAAWAVPAAALLGIVAGVLKGRSAAPTILGQRVRRHDAGTFMEHWTVTLATLALIVTGVLLGNVINARVIENVEAVGLSMNLHFVGAIALLFAVFHHFAYYMVREERWDIFPARGDVAKAVAHFSAMIGRGREPREAKYMASAKLAYLVWGTLLVAVSLTGAVKVAAHVWTDLSPDLMRVTTWLHDVVGLLIVLMLLVHLVIVLLPMSWPLLRSMFTGFVPVEYVKAHHADWYRDLEKEESLR